MKNNHLREAFHNHSLWLHDEGGRRLLLENEIIDFKELEFYAPLESTIISNCKLHNLGRFDSDLMDVEFRNCQFSECILRTSNLTGAKFIGCTGTLTFIECSLASSEFWKNEFLKVQFEESCFKNSTITDDTWLRGLINKCDFTEASLNNLDLRGIKIDQKTVLSDLKSLNKVVGDGKRIVSLEAGVSVVMTDSQISADGVIAPLEEGLSISKKSFNKLSTGLSWDSLFPVLKILSTRL